MNWVQINRYYWQSDTGYRISKAKVGEVVKYSAWYPVPESWPGRALGGSFAVLVDASAWCDDHVEVNRAA